MTARNLEEVLETAADPTDLLRNRNRGSVKYPNVPSEHTNWIEEQRSWRETCSLADQSHHMVDLRVHGPDALQLFADLGINSFDDFETGQAKQFVACNPNGYVIGDGILFRLDANTLHLVGLAPAPNWVQFNLETGDYDVSAARDDDSVLRDGDPKYFRYQIQGPNALPVMEEATDGPLPDIPFFNFAELSVDGREVYALRHGMSGEAGFEFWGPFEYGDEVKETVLTVGREYGIRQLGWKSYTSGVVPLGWMANPVPAVYGDEMAAYQRWLSADSYEAKFAVGGSFSSDDITDYYLSPYEIGYEPFVSFDHDFIGRAALEESAQDRSRTKVTLVWDADDVLDVFASLFRDGPTHKYMRLPIFLWASHYDQVLKNGEPVGVSKYPAYTYNERSMLSLGVIDDEYSDPGTEVTFIWGEKGEPSNPAVERHVQTEIDATVARSPYMTDRRKEVSSPTD